MWILGTAYVSWRIRDARFAILSVWLLAGLAAAALTNDTPSLQRFVGMVPTLALIPALFLERLLADRIWTPSANQEPWSPFDRPHVVNVAAAVFVLGVAVETIPFYFGPYAKAAHYYWYTLAGRYAQRLDHRRDMIYQVDVPEFFWRLGPALFLADRVEGRDLGNASDELPLVDDAGKNVHFLVYPSNAAYLPVLETYYPGGSTEIVNRPSGSLFFRAYVVAADRIEARRRLDVRYGPSASPLVERREPRLGTAPRPGEPAIEAPVSIAYPAAVRWTGGLVVPAYGTYRLALEAPSGASLVMDGRTILTTRADASGAIEVRVVLARGVHAVTLAGILATRDAPIALRWGSDREPLGPVARRFLWGGPLGAFVGESYEAATPDWLVADRVPPRSMPSNIERRDGLLGWRSINATLNGSRHVFGRWRGRLRVPAAGDYTFDTEGGGLVSLRLDGTLVAICGFGLIMEDAYFLSVLGVCTTSLTVLLPNSTLLRHRFLQVYLG